jgi:hypothetical protein
MLLLVDLLLVSGEHRVSALIPRYLPFAIVLIPYLALEYSYLSHSVYVKNLGYGFGSHLFSILGQYLALLIFPWGLEPPAGYVWLAIVATFFILVTFVRRNRNLIFLGAGSLLTLVPVLPFSFVFPRFLYLDLMFTSITLAALLEWTRRLLRNSWWSTLSAGGIVVFVVFVNGLAVAGGIENWDGYTREMRSPLRTISQWHPTLPEDTALYFIDPPMPVYSGMFFQKYGSLVSVWGDVAISQFIWQDLPAQLAGLRNHKAAYVYYFDDQNQMKEQQVEKEDSIEITPPLPVDFDVPIRLEACEIASAHVKHGEAIVALVYWKATGKIDQDYAVFAHLMNERGETVAGVDNQPRAGKAPTRSWEQDRWVFDWVVVPITDEIPLGKDYRLKIGWYFQPTMERLMMVDASGRTIGDSVTVAPFSIIK